MLEATTKLARGKLWLGTYPQSHRRLPVRARHLCCLAASLALNLCGLIVLGQEQPTQAAHVSQERSVGETQNRVLFDRDAFYNAPVPHWSNGYLISTTTESFSPGTFNVILRGRNGSKSLEVAFWFPDSQRVVITSADVSHHGGVLAAGEADKADGTRAFFVAFANLKGQVTNVIQTGDFHPRSVCEAPDGSIWAFGGMKWDTVKRERLAGDVLRRFDLQKGETASFVPGSTFPPRMEADMTSHIRCTSEAVFVYSNPANMLIELPYNAQSPQIYDISKPEGLEVITFAVNGSREVYGGLAYLGPDRGKGGLYMLALDKKQGSAHWQPVKGAVGRFTDEATVSGVWGVDEGNLVISRGGDTAGTAALHWVNVSPR